MKRFAAFILTIILAATPCAVFADGAPVTGEEAYEFIEDVKKFIIDNSKYKDIDDGKMAKAALKRIILENPGLYETALKGMSSSVDDYTEYFTADESKVFMQNLSGEFSGIGVALVGTNGDTVIQYVYENSPAQKSGIKSGDILIEVNGQNVQSKTVDEIVNTIKNTTGSPVEVKVRRYGAEGLLTFNMTCEQIDENPVYYTTYEENGVRVGYVALYSFSLTSDVHMKEAMSYFDSQGIKKIIFDLRGNSGGYLDQAINIANIFLKNGDIIALEEFSGETHKQVFIARENQNVKYETVILIDEKSASASEFVTAAIKENNRGTVIGVTSFGKATVQNIVPLNNGGLLKYTQAVYKTPNGNDINKVGIEPDITVRNEFKDTDVSALGSLSFSRIYKTGDRGGDILTAKKYLERLGFFYGDTESDEFDINMYLAVSLFQRSAGLFEYGELDITTQTTLYDKIVQCDDVIDKQLDAALEHFGITQK